MSKPVKLPLKPEWLENYRRLLDKVDGFAETLSRARALAGVPLACARGCSSCCFTELSVSPVEAASIREWLQGQEGFPEEVGEGPAETPPGPASLRGPAPCAFLDRSGSCALYPVRPLICRTHGLPIRLESGVDLCPLSGPPELPARAAGEVSMGGPAPDALNLGMLNTLLTAINTRFCQESGADEARVPLTVLRAEASAATA